MTSMHVLDHRCQHRPFDPEHVGEADGPADDAAQDVAPVLVGRDHAVGHQERGRAGVVGEEAEGDVGRLGLAELVGR